MVGGGAATDAGSPTSFWPDHQSTTKNSGDVDDSYFWNQSSFLKDDLSPDSCWDEPPPLFDLPDLPNLSFDALTDVFCETPKSLNAIVETTTTTTS